MTSITGAGRNFAGKGHVNGTEHRLASGILEVCAAGFPIRRNGSGDMPLDRLATAQQGAGQGGSDGPALNRGACSGRADAGCIARSKSEKAPQPTRLTVMSKVIQGIKTLFGMSKPEVANNFEKFHETADRVMSKTEMLLSERNGFAHSVKRMQSRKKKASKR